MNQKNIVLLILLYSGSAFAMDDFYSCKQTEDFYYQLVQKAMELSQEEPCNGLNNKFERFSSGKCKKLKSLEKEILNMTFRCVKRKDLTFKPDNVRFAEGEG